MALVMLCFHFSELYYFPSPLLHRGNHIIFSYSDDKPSYGLFLFTYLDRGFPLKSAISKALQNLMLSGISGMSAGEKRRIRVSTMDTQSAGGVGVILYEANHFKLLVITTRWPRVGNERNGREK